MHHLYFCLTLTHPFSLFFFDFLSFFSPYTDTPFLSLSLSLSLFISLSLFLSLSLSLSLLDSEVCITVAVQFILGSYNNVYNWLRGYLPEHRA